MSTPFDPTATVIVVHAVAYGPGGMRVLRLGLDTSASRTVIGHAPLIDLGYDPGAAPERVQGTMGASIEYSPLIAIDRIDALGHSREALPILAHTLPPPPGFTALSASTSCAGAASRSTSSPG